MLNYLFKIATSVMIKGVWICLERGVLKEMKELIVSYIGPIEENGVRLTGQEKKARVMKELQDVKDVANKSLNDIYSYMLDTFVGIVHAWLKQRPDEIASIRESITGGK